MKTYLVGAVVVLLVVVAFLFVYYPPRGKAEKDNQTTALVELRGFITAIVVDSVNGTGKTEYYLQVVKGGGRESYKLDFSNAVVRLRDPFNVYVGNPDRPVVVRGVIVDGRLVAYEIRDA